MRFALGKGPSTVVAAEGRSQGVNGDAAHECIGREFPDNADDQDCAIYAPPAGYRDWKEYANDPERAGVQLLGPSDEQLAKADLEVVAAQLPPTKPTEQVRDHLSDVALAHLQTVESR